MSQKPGGVPVSAEPFGSGIGRLDGASNTQHGSAERADALRIAAFNSVEEFNSSAAISLSPLISYLLAAQGVY